MLINRPVHVGAAPWLRGSAHYADGWIILDEPQEEDEPVLEDPGVLSIRFANLRQPEDVTEFASRYGLLRQGPGQETLQESYADWQRESATILALLDLH